MMVATGQASRDLPRRFWRFKVTGMLQSSEFDGC
jgi:hypothetical protein